MKNQHWWLTDASETQRLYPHTFYRPSKKTIGKLLVGSQVKLIFEFDNPDPDGPSAERMWVTLTEVNGDHFKGDLDNQPFHLKALKLGDPVEFEERHIMQTDIGEVEPDTVEKYSLRCFVTRKVLYDGDKAGYLYREQPDEEGDSGWRIMAGNESEQYMNEQENIFYVSLGAVLNNDDSFVHLLDSPTGSAFELDKEAGEFIAVK